MNFSDLVGPTAIYLREEMNSARTVHAYLFTGPAGTGKRTLADICARALLCAGDGAKPCGACPSCLQFLAGDNPDFLSLVPEKGKKQIGVDPVRETIKWLSIRPYAARRRVVAIPQANLMTPQAQNALLKTLETPPGDDAIILTSDRQEDMLPTIISRCRVIRFAPLGEDDVRKALLRKGMSEKDARLWARLSQGSVGRALALSGDEKWQKQRRAVVSALLSLRGPADAAYAAMPLCDKKAMTPDEALDLIELCARDLMALQDGGYVIQSDIEDTLARVALRGSAFLQNTLTARRVLKANVAWQYVIEMLFLNTTGGTIWQP